MTPTAVGKIISKQVGAFLPKQAKSQIRTLIFPNTVWPYYDYIVNPRHKFLYIWIPKVAGTSMKTWFLSTLGVDRHSEDGGVHLYIDDHYGLAARDSGEARRLLRSYPRMVVVRNPWTRIASAYLDKFVREPVNMQNIPVIDFIHSKRGKKVVHSGTFRWETMGTSTDLSVDPSIDYDEGISFQEFVSYLCETPDSELDVHWKPQHLFLGGRDSDSLLKLENLESDLRSFEEKTGIESIGIPHHHRGKKATSASAADLSESPAGDLRKVLGEFHPAELFTPQLIKKVGNRYEKDATRFNYRPPEDFVR